jgi:hypothetical protein
MQPAMQVFKSLLISDLSIHEKVTFITTQHLIKLLFEVKEKNPGVCFRFRLIGEMWQNRFFRVTNVSDNCSATFVNELTEESLFIKNLRDVIQFEIDTRYQEFEPHFHYNVTPFAVFKETEVRLK